MIRPVQTFLKLAAVVLLAPLLLLGGMGTGQVVCIDSDGTMTIEPVESPCCGRCCSRDLHPDRPMLAENSPADSTNDQPDSCVDVSFPGHTILAARVSVPPMMLAPDLLPLPVFIVQASLSPDLAVTSSSLSWPHGICRAGTARFAHLETIIIRC